MYSYMHSHDYRVHIKGTYHTQVFVFPTLRLFRVSSVYIDFNGNSFPIFSHSYYWNVVRNYAESIKSVFIFLT